MSAFARTGLVPSPRKDQVGQLKRSWALAKRLKNFPWKITAAPYELVA
jgi:hypothetical protein